MAGTPVQVTALFADRHTAHMAIEQLVQASFPRDAISVVMSETTHEREFGGGPPNESGIRRVRYDGVLATIAAGLGVLAKPGSEPLRVGGPLMAAVVRTGALAPALVALGVAEHEARDVSDGVRAGGMVVGVRAEAERLVLALQLLELAGGSALHAA